MMKIDERIICAIMAICAIVSLLVMLSGCAPAQERIVYKTIYQDVFIPTQCRVEPPIRPQRENDPALATVNIVEYVMALEIAFMACRGGDI